VKEALTPGPSPKAGRGVKEALTPGPSPKAGRGGKEASSLRLAAAGPGRSPSAF